MLRKKIFTLNWGSTRIYGTSIRSTEFINRLWWFIEMRWMAIILSLAAFILRPIGELYRTPGYRLLCIEPAN